MIQNEYITNYKLKQYIKDELFETCKEYFDAIHLVDQSKTDMKTVIQNYPLLPDKNMDLPMAILCLGADLNSIPAYSVFINAVLGCFLQKYLPNHILLDPWHWRKVIKRKWEENFHLMKRHHWEEIYKRLLVTIVDQSEDVKICS